MIQRIQSIFLLLTAILMAVTVFSPLAGLNDAEANKALVFMSCGIDGISGEIVLHSWGVLSFATLAAILPLISIFLYKKRKLQILLGQITSILVLLFYITFYVYLTSITSRESISFEEVQYGLILPVIALIFNTLAILNIKKDEKLVQSLNRIR